MDSEPRLSPRLWVKGQSGNPGGQPKGLVRYIRAKTRDGQALADFMLRLARGRRIRAWEEDPTTGRPVRVSLYPTLRDRREATEWLVDRAWGKAVQAVAAVDGGDAKTYEQWVHALWEVAALPVSGLLPPELPGPDDEAVVQRCRSHQPPGSTGPTL